VLAPATLDVTEPITQSLRGSIDWLSLLPALVVQRAPSTRLDQHRTVAAVHHAKAILHSA